MDNAERPKDASEARWLSDLVEGERRLAEIIGFVDLALSTFERLRPFDISARGEEHTKRYLAIVRQSEKTVLKQLSEIGELNSKLKEFEKLVDRRKEIMETMIDKKHKFNLGPVDKVDSQNR